MIELLHIGVLAAGGWAALALLRQVGRAAAYGRPRYLATPALGSRWTAGARACS